MDGHPVFAAADRGGILDFFDQQDYAVVAGALDADEVAFLNDFVDRSKDAIRRRGENISSMEVENEINAHPDVLECAVIPAESVHTEQEVMAVVVPDLSRALWIDAVGVDVEAFKRVANLERACCTDCWR